MVQIIYDINCNNWTYYIDGIEQLDHVGNFYFNHVNYPIIISCHRHPRIIQLHQGYKQAHISLRNMHQQQRVYTIFNSIIPFYFLSPSNPQLPQQLTKQHQEWRRWRWLKQNSPNESRQHNNKRSNEVQFSFSIDAERWQTSSKQESKKLNENSKKNFSSNFLPSLCSISAWIDPISNVFSYFLNSLPRAQATLSTLKINFFPLLLPAH